MANNVFPPVLGHVTLVLECLDGFDLAVYNLNPEQPLHFGIKQDSQAEEFKRAEVPLQGVAKISINKTNPESNTDSTIMALIFEGGNSIGIRFTPCEETSEPAEDKIQ